MKPKYPHKTTYLPDKLYHIRLYRVHLVPVTTDYIARCKSNYHIWWTGSTLSQLDHSSQFGPALNDALARFVYSRLFKYTQQHTSGFTENNIGPRTSLCVMVFKKRVLVFNVDCQILHARSSTTYKNQTEAAEKWYYQGGDFQTTTGKVCIDWWGRKNSLLLRLQCNYSFPNSTKASDVFSYHGTYNGPRSDVLYYDPTSPICHPGSCSTVRCAEPCEPSPIPSYINMCHIAPCQSYWLTIYLPSSKNYVI